MPPWGPLCPAEGEPERHGGGQLCLPLTIREDRYGGADAAAATAR
jgi:hypothetical protein